MKEFDALESMSAQELLAERDYLKDFCALDARLVILGAKDIFGCYYSEFNSHALIKHGLQLAMKELRSRADGRIKEIDALLAVGQGEVLKRCHVEYEKYYAGREAGESKQKVEGD